MKGYLERLLSTVTRKEQRVFPVVGSVFSEPLRELSDEVITPGAYMQDQRPEPVNSAQVQSTTNAVMHGEREQAPPRQPAQLLMPPLAQVPTSQAAEANPEPAAAAIVPKPRHDKDAANESKPAPRGKDEVRVVYATEQRNENAAFTSPLGRLPAAETPALKPQYPAIKKPIPVRRAEDQHATADKGGEVQVHIGRIEVIATPPVPPRNTHAVPNRFTSLSDYLNGRNGRTG